MSKTPKSRKGAATVSGPGKQVAVHKMEPAPSTPLAVIIQAARDPSMPVDKLERLFAMQREIQSKDERYLFDEAMRAVQTEMRPVRRDKKGERGWYASLDNIDAMLSPITLKNGFSLSYGSRPSLIEKHYAITCIVSHTGGHWREYQLDLPADSTGPEGKPNKTIVQGVVSTSSYAKRALKQLIFNVTIQNADKDGNPIASAETRSSDAPSNGTITPAQLKTIQGHIADTGLAATKVLDFVEKLSGQEIATVADIPAKHYADVIAAFAEFKAKNKK